MINHVRPLSVGHECANGAGKTRLQGHVHTRGALDAFRSSLEVSMQPRMRSRTFDGVRSRTARWLDQGRCSRRTQCSPLLRLAGCWAPRAGSGCAGYVGHVGLDVGRRRCSCQRCAGRSAERAGRPEFTRAISGNNPVGMGQFCTAGLG